MERKKLPNLRNGSKGGIRTQTRSIASLAFYHALSYRPPLCICIHAFLVYHTVYHPLSNALIASFTSKPSQQYYLCARLAPCGWPFDHHTDRPHGTRKNWPGGGTRGPYRRYTWDLSGPHHGPIWAPHGQSIQTPGSPHAGGLEGPLWMAHMGPKQNWSAPYKQPTLDIDPSDQETHFRVQKPDAVYGSNIASCCQPMLVPVTIEDSCS